MFEMLRIITPELLLALMAQIFLLVGVTSQTQQQRREPLIYSILFTLLLALVLNLLYKPLGEPLSGAFIVHDDFTCFVRTAVLAIAIFVVLVSFRHLASDQLDCYEYPILMLLSCVGMLLMLASNDLVLFFVGLELQSLPIYIMVALQRNEVLASEAATKYFVLGALSTIFILYGCSFIYGYSGSTNFEDIAEALGAFETIPAPFVIAVFFLLAGVAFKISVAPFHMWAPDVYQGSPMPVTIFLATVPKIAAMAFLVRLLLGPLSQFVEIWQVILQVLAAASIILGAFTALFQKNIKRLLAYSSISHMGFILIGLSSASISGIQAVLVYLLLYGIMVLGVFGCLLTLRRRTLMPEDIEDLRGLSKTSPKFAALLAILMFSLAGIPPLAGFFAKFLVFMSAVDTGHYLLVIVAAVSSVIAATYYLRIVKVMYFDEPVGGHTMLPYDPPVSKETTFIISLAAAINLLFFLNPDLLLKKTDEVAAVLFKSD